MPFSIWDGNECNAEQNDLGTWPAGPEKQIPFHYAKYSRIILHRGGGFLYYDIFWMQGNRRDCFFNVGLQ